MKIIASLFIIGIAYLGYVNLEIEYFYAIAGTALLFLSLLWFWKPEEVVFKLAGLTWTIRELCGSWYCQGGIGTGKTTSFINPLLYQLMRTVPDVGGLLVGVKGDEHVIVENSARENKKYWKKAGIETKHINLTVKPAHSPDNWKPKFRYNLIGDPSIKPATYASIISSTIKAVTEGNRTAFFEESAKQTIAESIELLRHIGEIPTLKMLYEMYVDSTKLITYINKARAIIIEGGGESVTEEDNEKVSTPIISITDAQKKANAEKTEKKEPEKEEKVMKADAEVVKRLVIIVASLKSKFMSEDGKDQSKGEKSTVTQMLAYFDDVHLADVFSPEPLTEEEKEKGIRDIDIKIVSSGVILTLAMPQVYSNERNFINNFLKCLFYQHCKDRFDLIGSGMAKETDFNLLLGVYDEAQSILTNTNDGYAERDIFDRLRSARVCFVCATQSFSSFIARLKSKDDAKVVYNNLTNKISFRVGDRESQEIISETIGKKYVTKKTKSGKVMRDITETNISNVKEWREIFPSSKFADLKKSEAVIVHGTKKFLMINWRKKKLKPIYPKKKKDKYEVEGEVKNKFKLWNKKK